MKEMQMVIVSLVFILTNLTTSFAIAAPGIPNLISSEMIGGPPGGEANSFLREIRAEDNQVYLLYYPIRDGKPDDLMTIEKVDSSSHRRIVFKHRLSINGRKDWTQWIPGSLGDRGHLPWDTSGQLLSMESARPLSQLTEQILTEETAKFQLFKSSVQLESNSDFKWEVGTYSWEFDPKKFKMWAGYLWDFKDGRLFKGYRTRPTTSPSGSLTPSENLAATEINEIKNYYSKLPSRILDDYRGEKSRAVSPLDKYGLWASRDHALEWSLPSSWEANHHFTQYAWGGYCNCSCALPYLWDRPTKKVIDHDLWFDPRDLVGIMQVASYQVEYLFWGNRFDGRSHDDIADPNPELVIDLLREYLGKNRMPIVYDWEAGPSVGNLLVLRSHLKIESTSDPLKRHATLILDSVGNLGDNELPAKEDEEATVRSWNGSTMAKIYGIDIELNPDETFKSAHWADTASHPDFFWLPIGLKDYEKSDAQNPYLKIKDIQRLIEKSTPDSRIIGAPWVDENSHP